MKYPFFLALFVLTLGACQETPQETARDVAEARREGAEDIREAQRERDRVVNEQRADGHDARERANAEYELAKTRAQAALDVEQERCDGLESTLRSSCKDNAKAVYDHAMADAERRKALAERGERVN